MIAQIKTERVLLAREVTHWTMAAARLHDLDDFAAPTAWHGLESYLGIALRQRLLSAVKRLQQQAELLRRQFNQANSAPLLHQVQRQLVQFRQLYIRTETTLDFYADAINTRTNPTVALMMRECDRLARQAMAQLLDVLGVATPQVLTYLDKGLGASILKAGLRLWDPSVESPVAAIKVVRHNLYRPTSLIHEVGHQVAHLTQWNAELADVLGREIPNASASVRELWASWASEIAADAFAFVHTGYASIASLHDVVSGGPQIVFRYIAGDPHPISYVRVLLGVAMCRHLFGAGPWDSLAGYWRKRYPLQQARPEVRELLALSEPLLPQIVRLILFRPMRAFNNRPLVAHIDPMCVAPRRLEQMAEQINQTRSQYWMTTDAVRTLALFGYLVATQTNRTQPILAQQHDWMLKLGA